MAEREHKISNFVIRAKGAKARADKTRSDLDEAIKFHSEYVKRLNKSFEAKREKLVDEHSYELRSLFEKHVSVMKKAQEDEH